MQKFSVLVAFAAGLGVCAIEAHSQTAADTMPGPAGYSTTFFYQLNGPITQRVGFRLTAATGGGLGDIVAPMTGSGAATIPAFFEVYSDNGGNVGSLLGVANGVVPAAASGFPTIVTFTPAAPISLAAGSEYWFVLGRPQTRQVEWYVNAAMLQGPEMWRDGVGGSYYQNAAFGAVRVMVPAPSAGALLGLTLIRRRRR